MQETWKTCSSYPNYKISTTGRLFSIKSNKILKGYKNTNGYIRYILRKDYKTYKPYAHQLVASAFISNNKDKLQVNHKDGNKLNNTVENLEWCTMSENIIHGFKNNLINNSGENNGMSKLSYDDAEKIRYLYKNTSLTQTLLANY